MAKCTIKPNKRNETMTLTLNNLTQGELLALVYALENHGTPVGDDVYNYVFYAIPENVKNKLNLCHKEEQ